MFGSLCGTFLGINLLGSNGENFNIIVSFHIAICGIATSVAEESALQVQCAFIKYAKEILPQFCFHFYKPSSLSKGDKGWGGSPGKVTKRR